MSVLAKLEFANKVYNYTAPLGIRYFFEYLTAFDEAKICVELILKNNEVTSFIFVPWQMVRDR